MLTWQFSPVAGASGEPCVGLALYTQCKNDCWINIVLFKLKIALPASFLSTKFERIHYLKRD